jgi:hypothetical protein
LIYEYRIMSHYIRQSNYLKEKNDLLYKDDRYKIIRNRCNDHTHFNFYKNVLLTDNEIFNKNYLGYLFKKKELKIYI